MNEQWKEVRGSSGAYQVSDRGRVRSVARVVIRSNGMPQTIKERILKQATRPDGRLVVGLYFANRNRKFLVHRLVADAFIEQHAANLQVNHKNGDPADNRASNLEWVTDKENQNHALDHGLNRSFGSGHGAAKLHETDLSRIHDQKTCGATNKEIGSMFGIDAAQVSRIVNGRAWVRADS